MSSTTVLAPRVLTAPAVEPTVELTVEPTVEPVAGCSEGDVLGLDAAGTLGFVVERRRRQDAAAAEELRAVTHWAELHRVGPGEGIGAVDPEIGTAVRRGADAAGLTGLLGVEGELRL